MKRTFPNLKTWRAHYGLSQREAAKALDISQTQYSRLERGTQAIKGPLAKTIRERTCVPLETLVGAA